MTDYLQTPIIRDPVQRKLMTEKDQALEEYIAYSKAYTEEDSRTQMKLILYVLRSYMVTIREQVQGLKGILLDFNALSQEIDSIFTIDFQSSNRFKRGLERYPLWLQNRIARRRAKKYYKQKISDMKFMLQDIQDKLEILPAFMGAFSSAIAGLSKGLGKSLSIDTTGKGKKKGGLTLSPEMQREIEERKRRGEGGGTGAGAGADAGSDTTGGSTGTDGTSGSTGGKPSGGGSDKWDD